MHHFIVLTEYESDSLLYMNVNNIDFLKDKNKGIFIYSSGSEDPIWVKESFEEVCQRINGVREREGK